MPIVDAVDHSPRRGPSPLRSTREAGSPGDLTFLMKCVRQRRRLVAGAALAGLGLGLVAQLTLPRRYVATAQMMLDYRRLVNVSPQEAVFNFRLSDAALDSQTEILMSDGVLGRAVDALDLAKDPAFIGGDGPLSRALISAGLAGDPAGQPPQERRQEAVLTLRKSLKVERLGLSYVIQITASAKTPEKAVKLADGVTDAYIADQMDARRSVASGALDWFETRLRELQADVTKAQHDAIAYRLANQIMLSDGKYIDEQQVQDLSSRLIASQERRFLAQARLTRADAIVAGQRGLDGVLPGSLGDEMRDPVIVALLNSYHDVSRRMQQNLALYGPAHEAVLKDQAEMRSLQDNILSQFRQIAAGARSDAEIAVSDEAAVGAMLAQAAAQAAQGQKARVELTLLQGAADSMTALRDNFVMQYSMSTQQQTFPITETRVTSRAGLPFEPAWPTPRKTLVGGLALGLIAGFCLAIGGEALSRRLRKTIGPGGGRRSPLPGLPAGLRRAVDPRREQAAAGRRDGTRRLRHRKVAGDAARHRQGGWPALQPRPRRRRRQGGRGRDDCSRRHRGHRRGGGAPSVAHRRRPPGCRHLGALRGGGGPGLRRVPARSRRRAGRGRGRGRRTPGLPAGRDAGRGARGNARRRRLRPTDRPPSTRLRPDNRRLSAAGAGGGSPLHRRCPRRLPARRALEHDHEGHRRRLPRRQPGGRGEAARGGVQPHPAPTRRHDRRRGPRGREHVAARPPCRAAPARFAATLGGPVPILMRSLRHPKTGQPESASPMQYRDQSLIRHAAALPPADPAPSLQNELRNALRFLRRRTRLVLLGALVGGALLGTYAVASRPTFRATTVIALDPSALAVLDTAEERAHKQDTPMQDSARVDSLVQVLQSDATLLRVIRKLHLQDDPEFNGTQPSAVKAAVAWAASLFAGNTPPASESQMVNRASINLALSQTVERAAGTYIVTVSILSKDPAKAATIANAFGDDYLDDQRRTDIETTRAAADWMKSRLTVLGDDMLRTQGAVAEFKSANAIATADGKSIADLMLSNISTKLSDAMGQSAQAKAKLDRIEHVNAQTTVDLSVADALSDSVITDLRKKYLDLQGRAANIAAQYGQNHAAAVKLRAEADVAMLSIRNELKRLEEASRSDYEIALINERATRASLDAQFLRTADVGRSQVKLQGLDSAATTAELAYEEALKRYTETVQKESFPMVQARIVARAVPPDEKFKPKTVLLVAIGTVGGLSVSLGYALVSELFDKRVYSRQQAERAAGADCLGVFSPDEGPLVEGCRDVQGDGARRRAA